MGEGKVGKAPCGHPGEAIIGQYYKCLWGCDDDSYIPDFNIVIPQCLCGSVDLDEDFELDPLYYVFNPGSSIMANTRCNECGRCWLR